MPIDRFLLRVYFSVFSSSLEGKQVVSVHGGSVHTCALLADGSVFSWGKHQFAGHDSSEDVLVPRHLDSFGGRAVKQLSVGRGGYHTMALCDTGEVRVSILFSIFRL